ncbi:hypothetical protein [Mycolicibacterium sp. HS_4_1]
MTSIVVWCGVDSRAPASLYIASDSRITWARGDGVSAWDRGRKTFASVSAPFIFGYWGDVQFPAMVIPMVLDRIDRGQYLGLQPQLAHEAIFGMIQRQWSSYPDHERRTMGIVIGSRDGDRSSDFHLSVANYSASSRRWKLQPVSMPLTSSVLELRGSGQTTVNEAVARWDASPAAGTSRAVFSAFCEALRSGEDAASGGPPQLVGLHRIKAGKNFGIVWNNQRYLSGADVLTTEYPDISGVEWFNELFERADPASRKRLPGAQVHQPR